jgi:thiol-disulfide isomerase/thioredoxin
VVNNDSVAYFQDLHERMANAATPYIVARNKQLKAAYAKYPTSYFTAYNALYSGSSTEEELKKIYAGFDDKMKESAIGKEWYERLFKVSRLEAGSVAPEFAIADMNGKQVKLSDMKGKYLLLDFWATWCGPCRAGNPHLVSLYNKYKSSGLEIIGIADDDKNIAGWKKAVKDDGIGIWPQVLRNRGAQTPEGEEADLAKLYMVSSYPTKILIDKTGKIVHQFSDDAELDSMLSTIFENK